MPPLPTPAALADLSARFGGVVDLLCRGIALWSRRTPTLAFLVNNRVRAHMRRLQAIFATLAAGRLPRTRPPRARTVAGNEAPPAVAGEPPKRSQRLPRRPGWLLPHALDIPAARSHLVLWLNDPDTRAVLAEIPQARRPLAALCRMLGIPPWPLPADGPLPPPPRRVRPPPGPSGHPPPPGEGNISPSPTSGEGGAERRVGGGSKPRQPRPPPEVFHHHNLETEAGLARPDRPWWMPPRRKRR